MERQHIIVQGQVQGVGFRPFVYRLAKEYELTGQVANTSQGVEIEIQGTTKNIEQFIYSLQHTLPPLAAITSCIHTSMPLRENANDFSIQLSSAAAGHHVLISPDVGLCAQCALDMRTEQGPRYKYAFTNCTNCGPRYTITKKIPYDRGTTSMACFPLCSTCQAEYTNPLDRRFHAQPNACPKCGPKLWCVDTLQLGQNATDYAGVGLQMQEEKAVLHVARALQEGRIVAMKGLGGFHLSCHAFNAQSIEILRKKKQRPHKPLAIMVPDVDMANRLVYMTAHEQSLLCSSEKPIVLCVRKPNLLPENIAPDGQSVGIMLPYTPLHQVLFSYYTQLLPKDALVALVMTSGNVSGEPICLGNREALQRLWPLAEVFLLHNRDILVRVDDSVCMSVASSIAPHDTGQDKQGIKQAKQVEETVFLRRARGYVPRPVHLFCNNSYDGPSVLGMGAELKSTLCLTRGNTAFVGQHIGSLENIETLAFYEEVAQHLQMLLEVKPTVLVHDLHPDFLSTQKAQEWALEYGIQCLALQHHVAHTYAVLAENACKDLLSHKILGLSLDGMGLGDDGSAWGGELLLVDTQALTHIRVGRLQPFALPGGDRAVHEPWRIALSLAYATRGQESFFEMLQDPSSSLWKQHVDVTLFEAVKCMLERNIQCPLTSSAGRLFDAVSAGLGLCTAISYEGQAAIRLEEVQKQMPWFGTKEQHTWDRLAQCSACQPQKNSDLWELSSSQLFAMAMQEGRERSNTSLGITDNNSLNVTNIHRAARNFHLRLAHGFTHMASLAAQEHGTYHIALSGGVMQNATMRMLLIRMLREKGFSVLLARNMPQGDGAISLGQAYFGLLHAQQR